MRSFAWPALLTATFLAACATGASNDSTLIADYPADFQAAAARELAALPPACQPGDAEAPPGCSPVRTLINDYKHLRDRLRVE